MSKQSIPQKSPVAESPHRHISFTAHYTGYIWFQEGISHPVLASSKGRFLAKMVSPLESWAELIIGDSMRSTLRQRHQLIDRQLDRFLAAYPDAQVLEIATGLSPRGWRYRQKYPDLIYVEADLPDMAAAKRSALMQIENPQPRIEAVDLFGEGFQQLLSTFDESKPLVIISEGLVNYFTKDMLHNLWTQLATGLRRFKVGIYLTDIYPEPVTRRLGRLIWQSSKLLRIMSRSAFAFHFISPVEIIDAMKQAGFSDIQVFQPAFENSNSVENSDAENQKTKHLGDLVWVIEAKA
ncbi:class I SAM-dependent methyltransferase [Aquirhabdus sp.]|uniref:class I SAM-dependent methyltransferase n=1 Tax=Aquirhabdus sp. TaxID=2824160 RepID=UPI00396C6ED4